MARDEEQTLRFALDQLEQMTSAEFQLGADRPARTALVERLHEIGKATDAEIAEYLD